jgi:hypothetical protein
VFFPASGYRDYNNYNKGSLSDVGSKGNDWSASAYGSNDILARNLYFRSSSSLSWSNNVRAYGYSVRAVAEE